MGLFNNMVKGQFGKPGPFELLTVGTKIEKGKKKDCLHRLKINNPEVYRDQRYAEWIFNQFALMHLAASDLPLKIEVDFPVHWAMRKIIAQMYKFYGQTRPVFMTPVGREFPEPKPRHYEYDALVSYSGGKDSMWNLYKTQKRFGPDQVLAVHTQGLNTSNSRAEYEASQKQARSIGFPLRNLQLVNGSALKGYEVMRSRDIFMVGLLIPIAVETGAKEIIIEGFSEATSGEPFSGQESVMKLFNDTLAEMEIPVKVNWYNKPEMDIVAEMYEQKPDWMPLVCNCFCPQYCKPYHRKRWAERHNDLFPLYESQCGACVKCHIINLGRIRSFCYSEWKYPDFAVVKYLTDLDHWIRTRGLDNHADMICGSFAMAYEFLCHYYDYSISSRTLDKLEAAV